MRKIFLLFSVLLLLSSALMAQTRTVSGTVTDEKGQTLPGVNVRVKGSDKATATDVNGKYSIVVTDMQTVVIGVSFVGYSYQERAISSNERNADFKLVPAATNLDEVVVVAYGEQKKIHLTGAIATIDNKQIQDIPSTSLANALRGQVAGLNVNGGNTRPGINNSSLTIRNPVSYGKTPNTSPLYIIDDIERSVNDFNALDQSEVESITILKDAAAAIYGIHGANGAVIVKTKRGKAGAPKVTYNGSYGVSTASELPVMMNGLQQATYLNDFAIAGQVATGHTIDAHGYIDGSPTNKLSTFYTPDELAYFADPANNTDFLRQAFKPAAIQRHTLSISGGSEKATYFADATYVNQNSNFEGYNSNRWTYRASADAKVADGLKIAISLSGSISKDVHGYFKQGGENVDNDFKVLLSTPQWTKFYINGLPTLLSSNTSNTNAIENFNYFAVRNTNDYTLSQPSTLNINPTITYDVPFVKGLKLTANYNRNINNTFGKQVGTNYVVDRFAGTGENNHIPGGAILNQLTQKNGDFIRLNPVFANTYELTGTASYTHQFGKHEISLLALYDQTENYSDSEAGEADGVVAGGYDNQNFTNGAQVVTEGVGQNGRLSYAGRLNYNYDSKYLFEALIRADGSTAFAPGHRWGYFPSFSAGWVISQEGFFKRGLPWVDLLKLRASLGFIGNDATGSSSFLYEENYNFGQTGHAAVFGGTADRGLSIYQGVALANPLVSWDNDTKSNLGIDLQVLKSRLSVTIDGFYDHRYNMLSSLSGATPVTVGATPPVENYSIVNSFGYEISTSWKDHIGKVSYYVSPFMAWSDDKLIKADQPSGQIGTFMDVNGFSDDRGFFGFKYAGFWRTPQEAAAFAAANPNYTINGQKPAAGMLYFVDMRGAKNTNAPGGYDPPDGKITADDETYLTNKKNNHFSGGMNFGASYKGFSAQVVISLGWGGQGSIEGDALNVGTSIANRPAFLAGNYWTPTNTNAEYPSPYYTKNFGFNDQPSDFWFKSSFQCRLTNFNLSYTIPKKIVEKLKLGDIRLFTNMVNPVNFYNPYSYRDNGVSTYLTYPTTVSYTFGLNVGF